MDLKKTLLPLALIALLAPMAAFAEHDGLWEGQMPPPHADQGRYELRSVQTWVPGRYEQVWVPEQCHTKHKWNGAVRVKCRGGYYDNRWVPGHYEAVQQWVWVPYRNYHGAEPYPYPHQNQRPYHQATPPVAPTAM